MGQSINVDVDALALHLVHRMLGRVDIATDLQPTLSGIFSDLFGFLNESNSNGDWFEVISGATADDNNSSNAYRIAEALTSVLPNSLVQGVLKALGGVVPQAAPAQAMTTPDTSPAKDLLPDLIQQLKRLTDPNASQAVLMLGAVTGMQKELLRSIMSSIPAPGGSSKWDPVKVVRIIQKALRDALKAISDANMPGVNTNRVKNEIIDELTGPFEKRMFIAAGLTGYVALIYGLDLSEDILAPSSGRPNFGTEVHQVLQQEYRKTRTGNAIVQESMLYFNGSGTPLPKAQTWDTNILALAIARGNIQALVQTALSSSLPDVEKYTLKDDNLDLTLGTEWEIKPILGAALGVIQEMLYRSLYNIIAALFLDIPTLAGPKITATPKGLVTRSHIFGGTAYQWPEISVNKARIIGGFGTVPRKAIILITVDSLPGMLIYYTYAFPLGTVVFAEALRQVLNKYAKDVGKGFDIIVEGIAVALMVMAAMLMVIGLIVALISGIGEIVAGIGAVLEVLAPILAVIGIKGAEVIDLVRDFAQQVAPLVSQYGLNVSRVDASGAGEIAMRFSLKPGTSSDAVPCDDASFGPLRLQGVPMAILACLPGLFAMAMQIAGAEIQNAAASAQPPPTANA